MRRTPYTERGVRRLKCWRVDCSNRAEYQWQVCADGRVYRPICAPCDVEVNRMVLEFMGDPLRNEKIATYRDRITGSDTREGEA